MISSRVDPESEEFELPSLPPSSIIPVLEYLEYHAKVPPRAIATPVVVESLESQVDEYDWALIERSSQEAIFDHLLVRHTAVTSHLIVMVYKVISLVHLSPFLSV